MMTPPHTPFAQGSLQQGEAIPLDRDGNAGQNAAVSLQDAAAHIESSFILRPRALPLASLPKSSQAQTQTQTQAMRLPATPIQQLGDAAFCAHFGVEHALVAGAMAHGIASPNLVIHMAQAGFLAFLGAAGQAPSTIDAGIARIQDAVGDAAFGVNLIHAPDAKGWEAAVVDVLLARGVRSVEASAFLQLTPDIVRYRIQGIQKRPDGSVHIPHRVMAKVSRPEVARQFLSPPPPKMVAQLLATGAITAEQANLAAHIPMADALTAEADSGGHTDHRPALALLPAMQALSLELAGPKGPAWVGLAGGIATPQAAAAAWAMGAAYVMTGSINQACVESGTSDDVRQMLATAGPADVAPAPAADMFEMGVNVQVLRRGTLFPMRGQYLYRLYRAYDGLKSLPIEDVKKLEKTIFMAPLEQIWQETAAFFQSRDPSQLARAQADEKHRMALVFRWYLGQSSRWATQGLRERKADFQIWCGPSMGAFNAWCAGSKLAKPGERRIAAVSKLLLRGSAMVMRQQWIRTCGFALPFAPPLAQDVLATTPLEPDAKPRYVGTHVDQTNPATPVSLPLAR